MIRPLIAIRGPRDVDGAVFDQQSRALILGARVERDVAVRVASVARAGHARLNQLRAARARGAGRDVDRVQPLREHAVLFRARHEVHRARGLIDRSGADDADVVDEVAIGATGLADVGALERQDVGRRIRVGDLPQRRGGRRIVRVERVDAVVVGRDVDDVADADAGYGHAGHVQRLSVDLVVDRALKELAELTDVDGGRGQDGLIEIGAGAPVIVVLRDDRRLRERGRRRQQRTREAGGDNRRGRCVRACGTRGWCGGHVVAQEQETRHSTDATACAKYSRRRARDSEPALGFVNRDRKSVSSPRRSISNVYSR